MIKRYSDHAANERTFLAWVRTSIAVMAFGFVIERFDRPKNSSLEHQSRVRRRWRAHQMSNISTKIALSPSRRTLNAMFLAALGAPLLPQPDVFAQGVASAPVPFRVNIPQATIDRILTRVREAEWPDRLDAPDLRYGVSWDYMKTLARYWTEQFDWRRAEANLNRYPQFHARVGDYNIHFYHLKGRGPKPLPLILTHGWPGSVFEFVDGIEPLSDPA